MFCMPVIAVLLLLFAPNAIGQLAWEAPEGINWRTETIYSEGTRLAAEVFSAADKSGEKLPCILMAHGWGGTVRGLRRDAVEFARAGYLAVAFDYRGWGNSDARVILAQPAPKGNPRRFQAEVIAIREVIDPVEQGRDWLNALHWLQSEPMCDTSRIGVWGSSYSGGHVLFAAAHDERVKAVFSQVGGMDSRFVVANSEQTTRTLDEATRRARGELAYPDPGAVAVGALRGAPIRDKLMHYAPVELAHQRGVRLQVGQAVASAPDLRPVDRVELTAPLAVPAVRPGVTHPWPREGIPAAADLHREPDRVQDVALGVSQDADAGARVDDRPVAYDLDGAIRNPTNLNFHVRYLLA